MSDGTRRAAAGWVSLLVGLGTVIALGWSAPAYAGDAEHGAKVFKTQCKECHSTTEGRNKRGPSLFGVVGRKAGSVADYRYSQAMMESGLTWTADSLDAYLAAPRKVVPGGKMRYRGLADDGARADLIAFLSQAR